MTTPGTPAEPRPSAPGTDPFATGYGTSPAGSAPTGTTPGGTSPTPARPSGPSRVGRAGRTAGRGLALTLLIAVTVVLVLFAVFNGETVPISLVFTDVRAPLVVALLIPAALGFLVPSLLGAVLAARRRNR